MTFIRRISKLAHSVLHSTQCTLFCGCARAIVDIVPHSERLSHTPSPTVGVLLHAVYPRVACPNLT